MNDIYIERREKLRKIHLYINDKVIYEALGLVSGYSKTDMEKLYMKIGDIGDVAYYVLSNKKQKELTL